MHEALSAWEKFLHERDRYPDLIQCGLMHEHFEAIHPFLDGNGRIGRLLITLFLMERRRLAQPLLYLSAYFKAHRQDYYDLLQRVGTRCDWTAWLHYFLTGVAETARDAVDRANRLTALWERFRKRLIDKPRAAELLDALFENPYITVARAKEILGVSNPTARQAVGHLQAACMLKEVSGRKWGQLYLAAPILKAIEQPA